MGDLLDRITVKPKIFEGKPILEMLAVGDTPEAILKGYPWLERDDIRACLE